MAEVCRKAGISDATFYNWRKRYGKLTPYSANRARLVSCLPVDADQFDASVLLASLQGVIAAFRLR